MHIFRLFHVFRSLAIYRSHLFFPYVQTSSPAALENNNDGVIVSYRFTILVKFHQKRQSVINCMERIISTLIYEYNRTCFRLIVNYNLLIEHLPTIQ